MAKRLFENTKASTFLAAVMLTILARTRLLKALLRHRLLLWHLSLSNANICLRVTGSLGTNKTSIRSSWRWKNCSFTTRSLTCCEQEKVLHFDSKQVSSQIKAFEFGHAASSERSLQIKLILRNFDTPKNNFIFWKWIILVLHFTKT